MEKTTFLPQSNRISSLDALRGFAVLGLAYMNVHGFSMVSAAFINPTVYGDLEGINKTVWVIGQVVADQKFISLLAMVFGIGILLFVRNVEGKGFAPAKFFYRRMFWWIIFGFVHAYVFWHGDYLVAMAICGAMAFLLKGLSSWVLLVFGAMIYFVPSFNYWLFGKTMEFWPPEAIQQLEHIWHPDQASLQLEINALRGGVLDQLAWRIPEAFKMQAVMFFVVNGWRILAMMMIGMGLYKTGLWNRDQSRKVYFLMALVAIIIGWWLSMTGVRKNFAANWDASYSMFFGWQWNYAGSLFSAIGYVALIMLVGSWMRLGLLVDVGKLACTNILVTTVICSFLFYGHGLGLFGKLGQMELSFIVVGLWLVLFLFSRYWLRWFHFGPLEWLVRFLTYGNKPQLKK